MKRKKLHNWKFIIRYSIFRTLPFRFEHFSGSLSIVSLPHQFFLIVPAFIVISFLFSGCATLQKKSPESRASGLIRTEPSDYPGFSDDMAYDGLAHSLMQSLSYLKRFPGGRTFRFGSDAFDNAHMIKSLETFLHFIKGKPSGRELEAFIVSNYLVYQSMGRINDGEILFTGYYEPILMGSTKKSIDYRFPVYPWPSDLVDIDLSRFSSRFKGEKIIGKVIGKTVAPYDERKLIDKNTSFGDRAKPLAWVNDPVDLFFLHIQGSGKICVEDGKTINIHYHTTNGRSYRSIGKLLIDQGKIDRSEMSMQNIRAYLKKHPDELERILHYNPSYIFFRIEKDGPLGFLEVKLSPGRSIALDRRLFPLAGLAFIETKKPVLDGSGKIHEWLDFGRFVTNQDTGGAIRGPGRADLFWGNGRYAEIAAGHMKHPGRLYFLVLKPEAK